MEKYILRNTSDNLLDALKLRFPEFSEFLLTYYECNKQEFPLPIWIASTQHSFSDADLAITDVPFPIKENDSIHSETDFMNVLHHIDYFDMYPYPDSFIMYCVQHTEISQTLESLQCTKEKKPFYKYLINLTNKCTIAETLVLNTKAFSDFLLRYLIGEIANIDTLIDLAIKHSNFQILDIVTDNKYNEYSQSYRFQMLAINYGNLNFLKYLKGKGYILNTWIHKNINNIEILEYLIDEGFTCDQTIVEDAVNKGRLDILKMCRHKNVHVFWDNLSCEVSSVDILEWFKEENIPINADLIYENSAFSGNLQIIKWLHFQDYAFNEIVPFIAAEHGHLPILEWAKSVDLCPMDQFLSDGAAGNGHLHILRWLLENGFPISIQATIRTVENKNYEILKWMFSSKLPLNIHMCKNAAKSGDLAMLKYLRSPSTGNAISGDNKENGCPWNELTCIFAARYGHLEVLKWAIENGCPFDAKKCIEPPPNNIDPHTPYHIREWIFNNG